jgi:hypothetical protein
MEYIQVILAIFAVLYCIFYQFKIAKYSFRNRPTMTTNEIAKKMIKGAKYQLLFILALAVVLVITKGSLFVSILIIGLQTWIIFGKPKKSPPVAFLEAKEKEVQ